ncbi:hypothetical protein IBL26_24695 [Roseomonas aerophila]|uniref:Uncharacterized protein n=1 Tax=Teichococcus aerophilus TaxID=1224513 RepID=A0ABR7RU12_9PROT|nr:hypothetical protein [Pseudoroseomonas aerophila]MBC9210047.1 hypothetical protein [Pseudoroseomonas aerophila]
MAQVSPCTSQAVFQSPDWFDTGNSPIGTFRFRGGRQAPTTRALIHYTPEGRRFIPARPEGFAAPPWRLEAWHEWQADLAWSLRRALKGQTPQALALSVVALDLRACAATLYHVLDRAPRGADEHDLNAIEAEVMADFIGCCRIGTLRAVVGQDGSASLPQGMVAYRRI